MTDKTHEIGETQELGRLAMREQGIYWVAYYAMADTMEGAVELGRIPMASIGPEHEDRRRMFMQMMQDIVGDIFEERLGVRPTWPDPPRTAPEHERET